MAARMDFCWVGKMAVESAKPVVAGLVDVKAVAKAEMRARWKVGLLDVLLVESMVVGTEYEKAA